MITLTSLTTFADAAIDATLADVAGQLAPTSRRVYAQDAKHFAVWLNEQGLSPHTLTRSDMVAYRKHLAERYAKATANRMFVVARRLLDEHVKNGHLKANPAETVKGFKVANETTHTALTKEQAKEMLERVDTSTTKGKRDYALLQLLLRTGMRRSECAALTIGAITVEQGHHVAVIEHGKGDKRRLVKLPVDVFRSIEAYLLAASRQHAPFDASLFTGCTKGDHSTNQGISDKLIERTVKQYAPDGIAITPHGLRASFVTIALESGAKLHQVQYAAGHADPRTTERYQKRKVNLDDNAVDYIKL